LEYDTSNSCHAIFAVVLMVKHAMQIQA
jgi:hypothetical protein